MPRWRERAKGGKGRRGGDLREWREGRRGGGMDEEGRGHGGGVRWEGGWRVGEMEGGMERRTDGGMDEEQEGWRERGMEGEVAGGRDEGQKGRERRGGKDGWRDGGRKKGTGVEGRRKSRMEEGMERWRHQGMDGLSDGEVVERSDGEMDGGMDGRRKGWKEGGMKGGRPAFSPEDSVSPSPQSPSPPTAMMSSSPANASSPLNATSAPIPGAAVGLALLSVAVVVGLPGNAMVLWSCAVTHRRSVPVLLIFHLALADVVTLLTGPIYLRALSVGQWNMGLAVCRGSNYLCAAAMYVSVFLIALLGLHRCLAVSKPATAVVSAGGPAGQLAHGAAAVTWLVALVLAIPSIVFRRVERGHCQRVHSTEAWLVVHNLLETILGWALPLTAVAAGYGLLIRRLRQTRLARRSRTFRLVAAVVVAFAVTWGPYHLASLLEVAVVVRGGGGTLEVAAKAIRSPATALAFLSSAMNPLLYACAGRRLCRGSGGSLLPRLLEVSAIAGSSRGTTA
uniref:G-protein coupled receptors family 1 profile domain-containing protein n=1 Tax=Accipiter nisus TaxID=211598 RepID=A0A8B9N5B0_9AVES